MWIIKMRELIEDGKKGVAEGTNAFNDSRLRFSAASCS